ncbi:MAG: ATP-dependent sacrificial sulfur transferase LarE [Anaerolineae bacterium]|nr:ATP-dependent sacrificial sulfur transferase LarE [Anaerolineae bacterium]
MNDSWLNNVSLSSDLQARWQELTGLIKSMQSVVVAFSGGVDSGLLAAAAYAALGNKMLALTISSPVESAGDVESASKLAAQVGFPLRVIEHNDLDDALFVANPPERCYHCKLIRFNRMKELAAAEGYAFMLEGSNADDLSDYRPGRHAVLETGTRSPLLELGMGKSEIRALAFALNLPIWNRPSAPCLATRFPYGSPITVEGLRQVADGERYLKELGFGTLRVRHHGSVARLEVPGDEIPKLVTLREPVLLFFKQLGFNYVALDLAGYRSGSLNEGLV